MSRTTKKEGDYDEPKRLSYSEDESAYPWLAMLLDAYHIVDEGVAEGIRREEKQGRKLSCDKGCASCCRTHKDIPVYPLELVGLSWYATEKIHETIREKLKEQLMNYQKGGACPFLVDNACSIHPMRPFACRQFNVFKRICAEGEDAYHARRQDVLTPIKKYTDKAFYIMLPFYGVTKNSERRRHVKEGSLHKTAREMRNCNWTSLVKKMDGYDKRNQKGE